MNERKKRMIRFGLNNIQIKEKNNQWKRRNKRISQSFNLIIHIAQ